MVLLVHFSFGWVVIVFAKGSNKLFQYIPAPSVPPSDSLDAASPQAAAEQGRYVYAVKDPLDGCI